MEIYQKIWAPEDRFCDGCFEKSMYGTYKVLRAKSIGNWTAYTIHPSAEQFEKTKGHQILKNLPKSEVLDYKFGNIWWMVTRPPPINRSGQVDRFRTMGEGERIKTHSLMIAWKWCLGRRKSDGILNNTWYISSTVGLRKPVIPVFRRYGRYGTTENEYSDRWRRRRVVLTMATWRTYTDSMSYLWRTVGYVHTYQMHIQHMSLRTICIFVPRRVPRIYAAIVTKQGKYKNIRYTYSTCRYDRFAYSSAQNRRDMPRNVTQRNKLNQYIIKEAHIQDVIIHAYSRRALPRALPGNMHIHRTFAFLCTYPIAIFMFPRIPVCAYPCTCHFRAIAALPRHFALPPIVIFHTST